MFNIIEDFYEPSDLGLIIINFINLHFHTDYQSNEKILWWG